MWSEVTFSFLDGNKFGMMKNDEKQSKTMKTLKNDEKWWKTLKNNEKQRKTKKNDERQRKTIKKMKYALLSKIKLCRDYTTDFTWKFQLEEMSS